MSITNKINFLIASIMGGAFFGYYFGVLYAIFFGILSFICGLLVIRGMAKNKDLNGGISKKSNKSTTPVNEIKPLRETRRKAAAS